MSTRFRRSAHDYELLPRASSESDELPNLERSASNTSWIDRLSELLPGVKKNISNPAAYAHLITPRRRRRSILRIFYWTLFLFPYFCLFLVLFWAIFLPSYTHLPKHYNDLRRWSLQVNTPGRANLRNEKVFIAASIYERNATLTSGEWGKSILELIDLLGPQNVYLSLYENDPDPVSKRALAEFQRNITCNSTVNDEEFDLGSLPRVTLPTGETHIKRIAFLAEVRNRALKPLRESEVVYDRLLFINDVNFYPIEAAQLLFSTNVDATGRANYGAACAIDFINAFKFYDRFATRDLDGYSMGIPFFPWFTSAGSSTSRSDVQAGKDAVRVKSCWGGMTAYEAKWFQKAQGTDSQDTQPTSPTPSPLLFRAEEDPFWDSSECCLINADLSYYRNGVDQASDSGIYMNPFVRVAYDPRTLSWLALTRRPEKLYSWIHNILNHAMRFPAFNPRREEKPGQTVVERVWEYDDPTAAFAGNGTATPKKELQGHYKDVERVAIPGGFCGGRKLLVINETPEDGKGKWYGIPPPVPPEGKAGLDP